MTSYDGKFAPGSMIYFVLKGDEKAATEAADRFMDYIANHAYSVTLAVSLGQIRTLIEEPYSMTHSALPPEVKQARGLEFKARAEKLAGEDTERKMMAA